MTVSLFLNPRSERVGKKGSRLANHVAEDGGRVFDLARLEALPGQVSAALDGSDVIIIEGGDGTVQCVMSEIMRQAEQASTDIPDIAIASGGMTNQIAGLVGMRRVGRSGLQKMLEDPEVIETPMLRLTPENDSDQNKAPDQFGFLFSTGALPMVTDYTKSELHTKGVGGSAAVVGGLVKAVTSERDTVMPATDCEIDWPGQHLEGPHLGTVATTLPSVTLGLDPFWGKENAPVRLTYVDGSYNRLYRHVVGVWAGRKSVDRSPDGFYSWNVDQADFHYDGPVMLDGEPLSIPNGRFRLSASRPIRLRR